MSQLLEATTCLSINIGKGLTAIAEAIRESAAATDRLAEATIVLARATAGEFDEAEEVPEPAKPGKGMGMGG